MTLICLASFTGLLSKPNTMDDAEREEKSYHNLLKEMRKLETRLDHLSQEIKKIGNTKK